MKKGNQFENQNSIMFIIHTFCFPEHAYNCKANLEYWTLVSVTSCQGTESFCP